MLERGKHFDVLNDDGVREYSLVIEDRDSHKSEVIRLKRKDNKSIILPKAFIIAVAEDLIR